MKDEIKDKVISIVLFLIIMGIFSALIVFSIIFIKEFSAQDTELAFEENSDDENVNENKRAKTYQSRPN